jgi:hypothetical protein
MTILQPEFVTPVRYNEFRLKNQLMVKYLYREKRLWNMSRICDKRILHSKSGDSEICHLKVI